tara:strand:- start:3793 stop:4269 length:477 start_codon:yes stop_codon:yes gene_type:complete
MPTVGNKKFNYDKEGMEAAELEAQQTGQDMDMVDKVDDTLSRLDMASTEDTPETTEEVLTEEPEVTPEDAVPDEGMLMQLFRIVYREDFDPANQKHQSQLSIIESTLDQNPEMVKELKAGDMSMTDFAIRVYKGMAPSAEGPKASPQDIPEFESSYFA